VSWRCLFRSHELVRRDRRDPQCQRHHAQRRGTQLGGNWRWDNDSGFSSGYRSLRANTSRQHTASRCFPLPRGVPLFLSNAAMLEYLERFADRRETQFEVDLEAVCR
jgi:cation diffusion facilitator CzcD-associated flavoprotein CzcO